MHLVERKLDSGAYETRTETRVSARRGATPIEIDTVETVVESASGAIQSFTLNQRLSKLPMTTRGTVKGESLQLRFETEGRRPRERTVAFDPKAVGPRQVRRLSKKSLRKEGDTLDCVVFHTHTSKTSAQRTLRGPKETVKLKNGREVSTTRCVQRIEGIPTGPMTMWVDESFEQIRTIVPVIGQEMEILLSSRSEILNTKSDTPPEILYSLSIPITRSIPRNSTRVRYRLQLTQPDSAVKIPETAGGAGQTIVSRDEASRAWTIDVAANAAPEDGPRGNATTDVAKYLRASSYVQSDATEITEAAASIVDDDDTCVEAAKKIERWVFREVRSKNLGTNFATALEVLERRE
ncbi:MAG: hypothetical protein AAF517_20235, partial [Planctomycetota bacterium]